MHNSQSEILADLRALRIGYRDTAGSKDTSKAELQLQRLEQAIRNSKGFFLRSFSQRRTALRTLGIPAVQHLHRVAENCLLSQPNLSRP
jgi:hypothetical protein